MVKCKLKQVIYLVNLIRDDPFLGLNRNINHSPSSALTIAYV